VANNNYPQVISVTSESLQSQIRNLLPSQEGFGTDLMAQNVIVPVIDLTSAAEGSSVPEFLQRAQAFGSQTAHSVANATQTLINTTGFYQITGNLNITQATGTPSITFQLEDGASSKIIYKYDTVVGNTADPLQIFTIEFVVFLAAGESLVCISSDNNGQFQGSSRQIADVNGTLINPSGFTPQ